MSKPTFPPVSELLANPANYAWNYLVYYIQFTQEQLLSVREYLDLVSMVKYQKCMTMEFLRTHFQKDIDDCLELDWDDVRARLAGTVIPVQYRERDDISYILKHPERFAWNELLSRLQFTREQLLSIRDFLHIPALVKYQKCVTLDWLETHFMEEINTCIDVDWSQIETYLTSR